MLCQKGGRVTGPCGLWHRPPRNLAQTQTRWIARYMTHAMHHVRCLFLSMIGAYKHHRAGIARKRAACLARHLRLLAPPQQVDLLDEDDESRL